MSIQPILRIQGFLLLFLGLANLFPAIVSLIYKDIGFYPFILSMLITSSTGLMLVLIFKQPAITLSQREGFIIVSLAWVLATLYGSLPFIFVDLFPSKLDAYFESVSGFTTTGATILSNIEALPPSILFWRAMVQWLGGMGIIVFSIAILPLLGIGGMQLYKAEVTGPVIEKLKPRIVETARSLWIVYILLSVLEFIMLRVFGMTTFDAITHTFTTMPSGGFSTKNLSIESFNSPAIEWIITFFMIAAGINFTLHYALFHGRFANHKKNKELHFFLCLIFLSMVLITFSLQQGTEADFTTNLRQAAFQSASIITTTGYSSTDFNNWSSFSQYLLVLLMFIGGCAGSTAGGIKCIRILLVLKIGYREIFYLIHRHAIAAVKLGGRTVPEGVLRGIAGFVIVYVLIFLIGVLGMFLCGLDTVSSLSAAASAIGNVGPGLGAVGPYENYLFLPAPGKLLLISMMLLGRLEIFTFLILFVPEFWKK